MKKIYFLTMAIITLLLTQNRLTAQLVYLPNTPDATAAQNITGVKNTGNFSLYFESSNFEVMCWDGDQPGIGWGRNDNPEPWFAFDGDNIGPIEDPDVALYAIHDTLYSFFIYTINGDVFYEIWNYSAGIWNIFTSATQIGVSSINSTPNVDIDDQNHLAAVWQQGDDIVLATGTIQGISNMYTVLQGGNGNDYESPDVAVFHDNSIPQKNNINISYLNQNTFNINWYSYNNPLNNGNLFQYQLNSSYHYGKPRIAAPVNPVMFDYKDFSAVITENTGSKWNLLSITRFKGQNSPLMTANISPDITNSECFDPAITYVGEDILISFVTNYYSGDYDVFQKKLNYKGDVYSYNYYSMVNISTSGDQIKPSVSGRYAPQNKAFYTFYDNSTFEILFKSSYVGNQNLRKSPHRIDAMIYPNPASGYVYINTNNPANYQIYNTQGKMVLNGNTQNTTKIDISLLPAGAYFIKIISDNEVVFKQLAVN